MQPRRANAGRDARTGKKAIALYKTVKGAVQLLAGAVLLVSIPLGSPNHLHRLAASFRHHLTRNWSLKAADIVLGNTTSRKLAWVALALVLDGTLTSVEGWALRRGRTWGAWLVVVASGSLLPFEARAFLRHERWVDLAGFILNAGIVVYLARVAWREQRAHR